MFEQLRVRSGAGRRAHCATSPVSSARSTTSRAPPSGEINTANQTKTAKRIKGKATLRRRSGVLQQAQEEALALLSNQASASGLEIRCEPPDPPLWVHADHVRLRQILVNLLSNAIKYNRPGGCVQLEAMPVGPDIVLSVSDTGRPSTR